MPLPFDMIDVVPLPVALPIGIFVLVLAVLVRQLFAPLRPRRSPSRSRPYPKFISTSASGTAPPFDATEQLRAVMAATFTARNVLSRTEAAVMAVAEAAITEAGLPWRVMAQVSLGEILASPSRAAFNAVNAKRVDLLIVSEASRPLAAIEYQGRGHYQGTAPARDAIKKEALRRAGIGYVEITFEQGPADVRREIARLAFKHAREKEPV